MRQKRLIRYRGKRKKNEPLEIDITSLLDILVIMLVFLLKSYNSSGVVFKVPKGVELPTSASTKPNTSGVIIQVSATTIWVDDEIILDLKPKRQDIASTQRGRVIIPLLNELVRKKEQVKQVQKQANAKKFSGLVNLLVDKSIRYNTVKRILRTCAEAGFKQYKFVVLSEES